MWEQKWLVCVESKGDVLGLVYIFSVAGFDLTRVEMSYIFTHDVLYLC